MSRMSRRAALYVIAAPALRAASDPWTVYRGARGPGSGKKIVLVSGDEEYRSEEALPQLGKILAAHHGFECTVLFAIDPANGTINPDIRDNIPGLEALRTADLLIIATRYRELPDAQMQVIDEYVHSGRPIIGLRTATHAFHYRTVSASRFKHYSDQDKSIWPGGFGQQVLGETWVSHHGQHGVQSTRGVVAPGAEGLPVMRGVSGVWGPTDVYTVRLPLPAGCQTLLLGEVLEGMNPGDRPVKRSNDPMVPVAWTRNFTGRSGKPARVFTTTMGAAVDFQNEGLRRLLVNAVYWAVEMEGKIPESTNVALVGKYEPTFFGFGKYKTGLKPSDFAWTP